MTDKFDNDFHVGDYVMFTGYDTSWRFGIVAYVRSCSVRIFEGWSNYYDDNNNSRTRYYHYTKRSPTQIIILEGSQITAAIQMHPPYVNNAWTFEEFMDAFEKYAKSLET